MKPRIIGGIDEVMFSIPACAHLCGMRRLVLYSDWLSQGYIGTSKDIASSCEFWNECLTIRWVWDHLFAVLIGFRA